MQLKERTSSKSFSSPGTGPSWQRSHPAAWLWSRHRSGRRTAARATAAPPPTLAPAPAPAAAAAAAPAAASGVAAEAGASGAAGSVPPSESQSGGRASWGNSGPRRGSAASSQLPSCCSSASVQSSWQPHWQPGPHRSHLLPRCAPFSGRLTDRRTTGGLQPQRQGAWLGRAPARSDHERERERVHLPAVGSAHRVPAAVLCCDTRCLRVRGRGQASATDHAMTEREGTFARTEALFSVLSLHQQRGLIVRLQTSIYFTLQKVNPSACATAAISRSVGRHLQLLHYNPRHPKPVRLP